MTKRTKILSIITIGVIAFIAFRIVTYESPLEDCLVNVGFIDEFDDLTAQKVSKFETTGTITGIEIAVEGQIKGKGLLTISYSDSTSYRKYRLDSGTVEIDHVSDWYSNICYVTFIPTTTAEGKLQIICDFIGD